MDAWIARRRTDVRFRNEMRRVEMPSTAPWYASAEGTKVTHHTFSAKTESSAMHAKKEASSHSSSDGEGGKTKKKKKKRKREDKGGSSTSDGSDGGPCWVRIADLFWSPSNSKFVSFVTYAVSRFVVRRAITSELPGQNRIPRARVVPREARKSRLTIVCSNNINSPFLNVHPAVWLTAVTHPLQTPEPGPGPC